MSTLVLLLTMPLALCGPTLLGARTADTGTVDTGTVDTGTVDTGTVDTGTVDTGTVDTGMTDLDGDGYAPPEDCDDTAAGVHPGAAEVCDPADVDEDCDGLIDDADPGVTGQSTGYPDTDGDGYGGTGALVACDLPDGTPVEATDCDDAASDIHPGAPEADCNDPIDYNCDGSAGVEDIDEDGFPACRDCEDGDVRFHPGAEEIDCTDPNDYNCDDSVGYADADGDHYAACEECDDGLAGANPGAVEHCDNIDNDCDGAVDNDAFDAPTWFIDVDGDGYTDLSMSVVACETPAGYLQGTADDCDDTDAGVYPGAEEVLDDGIDQDCDGADAEGEVVVDDTAPATDTGEKDGDSGCGCASGGGVAAGLWGLAALLIRRKQAR